MDQKEIDALLAQSQGSISEYNKKQDELRKTLSAREVPEAASGAPPPPKPPPAGEVTKKGKVVGQLSRVTEEAEAGTNMVMGYMENVLSVVSKQKNFIADILKTYKENPQIINTAEALEALSFVNDNMTGIEDLIFTAMDAFQFQDIGRQKLMKVMYTLTKLNEYLNELLGGEDDKEKPFGRHIEGKTLEKDKDKVRVDSIVDSYRQNGEDETESQPPVEEPVEAEDEAPDDAPTIVQSNTDVDDIIAQYHRQDTAREEELLETLTDPLPPESEPAPEPPPPSEGGNPSLSNDDIDALIAQYKDKGDQ